MQEEITLLTGTVPYEPNAFWDRVLHDQHQAVIVAGPRDIGKTAGCVAWIGINGYDRPGVIGAYISLTYQHVFEVLVPEMEKQYPGSQFRTVKGKPQILMPGGCIIWLFSAQEKSRVNRLKGIKRPDFWIWDEPAFYYFGVMAMCSPNYRSGSRQFYCSSKYPDTEFHNLVEKIAIEDPDHHVVYEPHGEAEEKPPHLTLEQWRHKRAEQKLWFAPAVYEREIENKWGSAEGAVFRHVDDAMERGHKRWAAVPPAGLKLAATVDIAKEVDWTWLAVIGKHNLKTTIGEGGWVIWFLDRMQQLEYDIQRQRLYDDTERQRKQLIGWWVDKGQVGASEIPQMRRLFGQDVHPVDYGSIKHPTYDTLKDKMVYELALAFDRGQVDIAPTPLAEMAAIELRRYAYQHSTVPGRVKYGAPPGFHDDAVSCALQATVAVNFLDMSPATTLHIPETTWLPSIPKKYKSFYTR